jgi:hypothetical protein
MLAGRQCYLKMSVTDRGCIRFTQSDPHDRGVRVCNFTRNVETTTCTRYPVLILPFQTHE